MQSACFKGALHSFNAFVQSNIVRLLYIRSPLIWQTQNGSEVTWLLYLFDRFDRTCGNFHAPPLPTPSSYRQRILSPSVCWKPENTRVTAATPNIEPRVMHRADSGVIPRLEWWTSLQALCAHANRHDSLNWFDMVTHTNIRTENQSTWTSCLRWNFFIYCDQPIHIWRYSEWRKMLTITEDRNSANLLNKILVLTNCYFNRMEPHPHFTSAAHTFLNESSLAGCMGRREKVVWSGRPFLSGVLEDSVYRDRPTTLWHLKEGFEKINSNIQLSKCLPQCDGSIPLLQWTNLRAGWTFVRFTNFANVM